MCGRYYIDDGTVRAIEMLIRQIHAERKMDRAKALTSIAGRIGAKDIHPTEMAPVLAGKSGAVCCGWQRWGFPGFQGKQMVFNARCESVLEKPLFRDSIRYGRIAVPAAWFYEWNVRKEKSTFHRKDTSALFMAGCCRGYEDGEHFVILTTAANASMEPVHDRMPLILEPEEVAGWILDEEKMGDILHKTPCLLERSSDYEQLSLF